MNNSADKLLGIMRNRQQTLDFVAEIDRLGSAVSLVARQMVILASALRRSVDVSKSTTAPPPATAERSTTATGS